MAQTKYNWHIPYNLHKISQRVVAQHLAHICLALIDETMYRNYWKGTRGTLAHRHNPYNLYKISQRVMAQHLAHLCLSLIDKTGWKGLVLIR